MKIQTNCCVSQVGRTFFTQNFGNRRTDFASFVFNQIHNNFHFHEVFHFFEVSKQFSDFHRKN